MTFPYTIKSHWRCCAGHQQRSTSILGHMGSGAQLGMGQASHPAIPTQCVGDENIWDRYYSLMAPGFRDDNGTAILGHVCKNFLARQHLLGFLSWHSRWCQDLKAIFQEVEEEVVHCDFYGGDLFQYMDINCSHNSKEIAKREKQGMVFYAHKMERNKKYSVFWDVIQRSGLIIFKFLWGLGFGLCSLKVYKCF